tara:strand:- start:725 stop:1351 length:627 start_codon:yes stop_codon:yes gene_type:complete
MKKLLFVFIIIFTNICSAQIERDSISGEVTYIKINKVDLPLSEIKLYSNSWIVENFKNTNEGIKLNTEKKIISKGVFNGTLINGLNGEGNCEINYIFEISFKEKKYRIKFSSFKVESKDYPRFADLIFERPTNDIETYKKDLMQKAELEKKSRKKKMLKVANNPKQLKEYFEYSSVRDEHIIKQIESKCEILSKSIQSYLLKQSKDKW